jgi:DNA gyrase/topoisomerase IV subunit A
MNKIIPVFYSEYGRYINRFRAIPFYIDGLKPVERRILLTLFEEAKKDFVKSAKIVGYCIAKYHPHGDNSTYGTLVQLVHQDYAVGKGNWGSPGLTDSSAAAYRYSEVHLAEWVKDLVFSYIDFVPWQEFELESEPLYLPCPVPLGLIGEGIITGISFYKTVIPKYTLKDLAKRLVWLLENKKEVKMSTEKKLTPLTHGPEIEPNIKNCTITEAGINQFYNILINGVGNVNVIPDGKIEDKSIKILGRAPNASFNSLIEDVKEGKLEIDLRDASKKGNIHVIVEPRKRNADLNQIASTIWSDYLVRKLNFNSIFCNSDGRVETMGVDGIIRNSYEAWKYAVLCKRADEYTKLINKKIEYMVVAIIRSIFEETKATTINDIVKKFHDYENKSGGTLAVEIEEYNLEKNIWKKELRDVTEKDIIDVCSKRNIRNLVETNIDLKKIDNDVSTAKKSVMDTDLECYSYVKILQN